MGRAATSPQQTPASPSPRRISRASLATAAALLAALALLTPAARRSLDPKAVLWIYDLAVVAASLLGVVLSAALWRSFEAGEVSRTIWRSLTLGLALWTMGEAIWAVDQLLLNDRLGDPSPADAVWLLGYVPLSAGLFLRYRTYRIKPRTIWHALLFTAIALMLALITLTLILPEVRSPAENHWLEHAVNTLYPMGDLLLAYLALLIVSGLAGGSLSSPWRLLAAGYLCVTLSDLLFAYAVRLGLYQTAPTPAPNLPSLAADWLYLASYLAIALGTYQHARLQRAL